ncbi:hypothetical protein GCM10027517_09140 [Phycicoccus ginsengisoli]
MSPAKAMVRVPGSDDVLAAPAPDVVGAAPRVAVRSVVAEGEEEGAGAVPVAAGRPVAARAPGPVADPSAAPAHPAASSAQSAATAGVDRRMGAECRSA